MIATENKQLDTILSYNWLQFLLFNFINYVIVIFINVTLNFKVESILYIVSTTAYMAYILYLNQQCKRIFGTIQWKMFSYYEQRYVSSKSNKPNKSNWNCNDNSRWIKIQELSVYKHCFKFQLYQLLELNPTMLLNYLTLVIGYAVLGIQTK